MQLFVDSNHLSPYAMSAFVGLREKSLPFEVVPVDLQAGAQHAPAYAAVSLTHRVPALCDGTFHLSESSAICEYLDDAYPAARLYPADLKDRARAREMQAWLRTDFLPLRAERSTEVVFLERALPPLSPAAQAAADKLMAGVAQRLAPGAEHLFGAWCIADTDLALMLQRLIRAGDPVPEPLVTYARQQWQRPSVQDWVRMARPDVGA